LDTVAFGGMKQPEALIYWFSEGFTDYYTFQLLNDIRSKIGCIAPHIFRH
jgi:predicted metalloprotease with PDZ domain